MGGVAWTEEEDNLLKKCVEQYGEGKWHRVPVLAGLNRCRKSCRLRWLNYLRPNIRRGTFTDDEVLLIIKLHNRFGNRWSLIASQLHGRTANDVKNYWNCHLSKKFGNPTSPVATNSQVNFTAHHNLQAPTSSTDPPQQDKASSMHTEEIYGLEFGRALSNGTTSSMDDFVSMYEFEEAKMKAGGEISSMLDNNVWDCDELIFDMDLWG
ncbi:unnamed protein product [Rhodiola kirilowii]